MAQGARRRAATSSSRPTAPASACRCGRSSPRRPSSSCARPATSRIGLRRRSGHGATLDPNRSHRLLRLLLRLLRAAQRRVRRVCGALAAA
eukprot:2738959-Prymnesium_polylepis.1